MRLRLLEIIFIAVLSLAFIPKSTLGQICPGKTVLIYPDNTVDIVCEEVEVIYAEKDGRIEIPAVGFESNTGWNRIASVLNTPDNGVHLDDTSGPHVTYKVRFESSGTYHVWFNYLEHISFASDSVHYGMNGEYVNSIYFPDGHFWTNILQSGGGDATIDVVAGDAIFDVWMREDGTNFEKIIIAKDPGFNP